MRPLMHPLAVFLPGALLLQMCYPVVWGSDADVDTIDLDTIFFSNAGPADHMQALGLKDFIDDDDPGPANKPDGSASGRPTSRGAAPPAPPLPKKKAPAPPAPPRPPSAPDSPPAQTGSGPTGGAWSAVKQLASGAAHLAQDVAHGTAHAAQNVMKATHTAPDAGRQEDIKAAQERIAAKRRSEMQKRSKQPVQAPVVPAPESNCSIYARKVCNHFEKQFIVNQRKDSLEKARAELGHWEGEIARGVTQTPHGQMRYSTMVRIVKEIIAYIEKHGGEKTKLDINTDKLEL